MLVVRMVLSATTGPATQRYGSSGSGHGVATLSFAAGSRGLLPVANVPGLHSELATNAPLTCPAVLPGARDSMSVGSAGLDRLIALM